MISNINNVFYMFKKYDHKIKNITPQAFYCIDFEDPDAGYPADINNDRYDGCVKECRDDEVLIIDPIRLDWTCVPKVLGVEGICPGKFNTGMTFLYIFVSLFPPFFLLNKLIFSIYIQHTIQSDIKKESQILLKSLIHI